MRGLGIDLRASAAATVLGLSGGVIAYRYVYKPALHAARGDAPAAAAASTPAAAGPHPSRGVERVTSPAALDVLGEERVVVLVTRGHDARQARDAVAAFNAAVAELGSDPAAAGLRYFVVDDASAAVPTASLMARLGVAHDAPYVVLLDRYAATEAKYLMPGRALPTARSTAAFVRGFLRGTLTPARLGQPRPPGDRHARWKVRRWRSGGCCEGRRGWVAWCVCVLVRRRGGGGCQRSAWYRSRWVNAGEGDE